MSTMDEAKPISTEVVSEIKTLLEEYRKLYRTDSKSAKSRRTEVRSRLKELGCPAEMTYRARSGR